MCLDVPHHVRDAATTFWEIALGARARSGNTYPEYSVFDGPGGRGLLLQSVGDAEARVHFDIHTDDRVAECERLTAAGATWIGGQDDWMVMRDPAGIIFCVVQVDPDHESLVGAQEWN
jgi:catechol 2,3-dioxygenase-like lactoylglutathione lyase family enzyme